MIICSHISSKNELVIHHQIFHQEKVDLFGPEWWLWQSDPSPPDNRYVFKMARIWKKHEKNPQGKKKKFVTLNYNTVHRRLNFSFEVATETVIPAYNV